MGLLGGLLLAGAGAMLLDALSKSSGSKKEKVIELTEEEQQEIEEILEEIIKCNGLIEKEIKVLEDERKSFDEAFKAISDIKKGYNQVMLHADDSLEMLRLNSYAKNVKEAVKLLKKVKNIQFLEGNGLDAKYILAQYNVQIKNAELLLKLSEEQGAKYGFTLFEGSQQKFTMEKMRKKDGFTYFDSGKRWQLEEKTNDEMPNNITINNVNISDLYRDREQLESNITLKVKEYRAMYSQKYTKCKTSASVCYELWENQQNILPDIKGLYSEYREVVERAKQVEKYYNNKKNNKNIETYLGELVKMTDLVGNLSNSEDTVASLFYSDYNFLKNDVIKKHCNLFKWRVSFEKLSQTEQKAVCDFFERTDMLVEMLHTPIIMENGEFNLVKNADHFKEMQKEVKGINARFKELTRLDWKDWKLLFFGIAIQSVMLVFDEKYIKSIDKSKRLSASEGDKLVKEKKKRLKKKYGEEYFFSENYSVPYDATKGAKENGICLHGQYHRGYTPGHNPILGWLYGTCNILTDTCTVYLEDEKKYVTYAMKENEFAISEHKIDNKEMFGIAFEIARVEPKLLLYALARQYIHLCSDIKTKVGLPIPRIVGTLTFRNVDALYKTGYDWLSEKQNMVKGGGNFLLTNCGMMIIWMIRKLSYEPITGGNKKIYDEKTLRMLSILSSYAATGKSAKSMIKENWEQAAFGISLQVAESAFLIATDIHTQHKLKEEFISGQIRLKEEALLNG